MREERELQDHIALSKPHIARFVKVFGTKYKETYSYETLCLLVLGYCAAITDRDVAEFTRSVLMEGVEP